MIDLYKNMTSASATISRTPIGRFIAPNRISRIEVEGQSTNPVREKWVRPIFPLRKEFFTESVLDELQRALPTLASKSLEPIKLHIGAPSESPPGGMVQSLKDSQSVPGAHVYSSSRGEPVLLDAVAAHMKERYQVDVDPSQEVCITYGSCPGIFFALRDLLKGGITIVPTPGYPPFITAAEIGEHNIFGIPLTKENNYMPDLGKVFQHLEEIHAADKVSSVIINYPHNPTGAIASLDYLEKIVELARKYNFLIISDLAYGEVYSPSGEKPHSIFEIPGAKGYAIELHSFGKTFNATGARAGFAISDPETINDLEGKIAFENIANVHKPIQFAVARALTDPGCQEDLQRRNLEYKERFDLMANGLRDLGWQVDDFDRGGFFLWVKVPEAETTSKEFFNKLLYNAGVVVVPGDSFGEEGEGFIRISLTQPKEKLQEVLQRLATYGFNYSN